MILEPIPKGLRKVYSQKFPGRNLHHLIPRSRGGVSGQFNLYPYKKQAHSAYHDIFSNMRLDEIWDLLPQIHARIFESKSEDIKMRWLESCLLEIGTSKERENFRVNNIERTRKLVSIEILQEKWVLAFGGDSQATARKKMKEMMLYMIFGMNVLNSDILFNNGNLDKFLELLPCDAERFWAFSICFGPSGCSFQAMKSRIAKILVK